MDDSQKALSCIRKRIDFLSHLVINGVFGGLGWLVYQDGISKLKGTFSHDYADWIGIMVYLVGAFFSRKAYDKIPSPY